MLLKPPGRGLGEELTEDVAAEAEGVDFCMLFRESSVVTGSSIGKAELASMDERSCFLLLSSVTAGLSSILIAVSGICSGSSSMTPCSLPSSTSLLGDHCMSAGAEEGPGVTASGMDV